MITSKSLQKALRRVVEDAVTPLTCSEMRQRLSQLVDFNFCEEELVDSLADMVVEGELLPDTAVFFRRVE